MNAIKATVKNRQVPADCPEGSEVVNNWSAEADAIPALGYEELRSLAERFPPPPQWSEEEDNLF